MMDALGVIIILVGCCGVARERTPCNLRLVDLRERKERVAHLGVPSTSSQPSFCILLPKMLPPPTSLGDSLSLLAPTRARALREAAAATFPPLNQFPLIGGGGGWEKSSVGEDFLVLRVHIHGMFLTRSDYDRGSLSTSSASNHLTHTPFRCQHVFP